MKRSFVFGNICCMTIGYIMIALASVEVVSGQETSVALPERHRVAPDSCLFYASWKGLRVEDPQKSSTEKWMSQPELVEFGRKVEESVSKAIEFHIPEDDQGGLPRLMAFAGSELLFAMLENPGVFYLSDFEIGEDPQLQMGCFLDLKGRAEKVLELKKQIDQALEKSEVFQFKKVMIEGKEFSSIGFPQSPLGLYWNVDRSKFSFVSSPKVWKQYIASKKTPAPKWLQEVRSQLSQDRLTSITYVNIQGVLKKFENKIPAEARHVLNGTGLDKLTDFVISTGLNKDGTVVKGAFRCSDPNAAFLNLFSKDGFERDDFATVSGSENYLLALKLDSRKIMDFVNLVGNLNGQPNLLESIFEAAEEEEGIDLESVLEAIGPDIKVVGKMILPNPLVGLGFEVEINDKDAFSRGYAAMVNKMKEMAAEFPEDGIQERKPKIEKRNGYEMVSIGTPDGVRVYYAHNGKKLAIAFSPRRVARILKAKPAKKRLTDQVFLKKVFENKLHKGKPFFVSLVDSKPGIQTVIPLLKGMIPSDQVIPGTDLSIKDVPSVKTLLNGWEPTVSAVYRTDRGLEYSSQMTAPVFSPGMMAGVGVGLLLPAVQQARSAARAAVSQNNVRQLLLGMLNFEATHERCPARYSSDKNGKPLLSWRVHLLPYMGYTDLYEKFRLNEPWDSKHNIKLLKEMPEIYANPSLPEQNGKTSYLAVKGAKSFLSDPIKKGSNLGMRIAQVTDGTSSTVCIVEVGPKHLVPWTAPQDFEYEKENAASMLAGVRPRGIAAGFVDGSVNLISNPTDPDVWKELKKMFTRNGGEVVDLSFQP